MEVAALPHNGPTLRPRCRRYPSGTRDWTSVVESTVALGAVAGVLLLARRRNRSGIEKPRPRAGGRLGSTRSTGLIVTHDRRRGPMTGSSPPGGKNPLPTLFDIEESH